VVRSGAMTDLVDEAKGHGRPSIWRFNNTVCRLACQKSAC